MLAMVCHSVLLLWWFHHCCMGYCSRMMGVLVSIVVDSMMLDRGVHFEWMMLLIACDLFMHYR